MYMQEENARTGGIEKKKKKKKCKVSSIVVRLNRASLTSVFFRVMTVLFSWLSMLTICSDTEVTWS